MEQWTNISGFGCTHTIYTLFCTNLQKFNFMFFFSFSVQTKIDLDMQKKNPSWGVNPKKAHVK